jgi:hypothetical protein
MSRDVTKPTTPKQARDAKDAVSRLKSDLMKDALGRMFGEDGEKTVPGTPRVILALANHAQTANRAKVLQREMFQAAAGSGLEMKFAFYGADNAAGVRRCRITTRWFTDPDDMAGVMDRAECNCGCYVNIRGERYLDQTRNRARQVGRAVGVARERETGRLGRSREQK